MSTLFVKVINASSGQPISRYGDSKVRVKYSVMGEAAWADEPVGSNGTLSIAREFDPGAVVRVEAHVTIGGKRYSSSKEVPLSPGSNTVTIPWTPPEMSGPVSVGKGATTSMSLGVIGSAVGIALILLSMGGKK